jgi:hypothetical protein
MYHRIARRQQDVAPLREATATDRHCWLADSLRERLFVYQLLSVVFVQSLSWQMVACFTRKSFEKRKRRFDPSLTTGSVEAMLSVDNRNVPTIRSRMLID